MKKILLSLRALLLSSRAQSRDLLLCHPGLRSGIHKNRFRVKHGMTVVAGMTIVFFLAFLFLFASPKSALAATATWTNGGVDGLWATCGNWSGGTDII